MKKKNRYFVSLEVKVKHPTRLIREVRKRYAQDPSLTDVNDRTLTAEEAIENPLDAVSELIHRALPNSVEVTHERLDEESNYRREARNKLRRRRPLTPSHTNVDITSRVPESTPKLIWEVEVCCSHAEGLIRDTAVFLIERGGSGFDLWYKEHLLSQRATKRHSWKTRQRAYRRINVDPYLEAVNEAWAAYQEPTPAGTFRDREKVLV